MVLMKFLSMLQSYVSAKVLLIDFPHCHWLKRFTLAHTFPEQAEGLLQTKNKLRYRPPHVFPYRTVSTGQAKISNPFTGWSCLPITNIYRHKSVSCVILLLQHQRTQFHSPEEYFAFQIVTLHRSLWRVPTVSFNA